MYNTTALDFLPLWLIFIGAAISIILAVEIGYSFGRRRSLGLTDDENAHVGGGVAATLGLLAFMLAFTFGAGTDRWDTKKVLILAETNAIGTAFLRSDLLEQPHRSAVQHLLSEYLDHRLNVMQQQTSAGFRENITDYAKRLEIALKEAKVFHKQLWQQTKEVASNNPTPITALFVSAINEVIDLHQERVTNSVQQRMPLVFWIVLYSLAMLAMVLLGYDAGISRGARSLSAWMVAISFATIMLLVVALDRPQTSRVGQLPMLGLQADIHSTLRGE
jgi:hypothetical protein